MKRVKLLNDIIKKHYLELLGAIVLLLIAIFIRTLEPKIIQVVIDSLTTSKFISKDRFSIYILKVISLFKQNSIYLNIGLLCLFYIVLACFRASFILISRAISYNAAERSIQDFRIGIFEHIQKIPISSFNILNKGELIQRSTGDIDTIKNFISNHTIELIRLLALFVFSSFMIFQINFEYAMYSLSLCPLIFISTYLFFQYEGKTWKIHEDEADKLTNIAQENLNGIRTVKAYNKMSSEIEKFDNQNQEKFKIGMKHVRLHTFFWPLADLLTFTQTMIVIILGGIFVLDHKMSIGALVAAYTYNSMLGFPLRQAGRVLSQMSMALVAIDRIQHILTIPLETTKGVKVDNLTGDIRVENLSFKYKEETNLVLKDISFHVRQGEKVAIMGGSASGKTSLVKLLLRLYEPNSGKILINENPISQYKLNAYRNRIGLVMQQSVLFSMSLSENLSYANEVSSLDEKRTKMALAGFENFESVLPKGLETEIGEKGVSLSGGQKQRLALARTLIKDHDILILDDITSALDKETEIKVLDNVFHLSQSKTVFIITHRISTLDKVDKVLVLSSKGEVQSFGPPKEMIRQDVFLKELENIESNNLSSINS